MSKRKILKILLIFFVTFGFVTTSLPFKNAALAAEPRLEVITIDEGHPDDERKILIYTDENGDQWEATNGEDIDGRQIFQEYPPPWNPPENYEPETVTPFDPGTFQVNQSDYGRAEWTFTDEDGNRWTKPRVDHATDTGYDILIDKYGNEFYFDEEGNAVQMDSSNSGADGGSSAGSCYACGCAICIPVIQNRHKSIKRHVTSQFVAYRTWLANDYFSNNILPAMKSMTEQLTVVGMQQVKIIGSFFDAKHQLESQRLFQTLTARAHKDYHPSEELCEIGTSVRSLASSERRSNLTQLAFANRMMQRQLLSKDVLSGMGSVSDRESRLSQFRTTYCNPADNSDGLGLLCAGGGPVEQRNRDVNYTNTIENELTLDIDFTTTDGNPISNDEKNVFAMSANLFGHQVLSSVMNRLLADENNTPRKLQNLFAKQRAVAAKRSVAQNSFAALTSMRARGNGENAPFLKAIIKELGVQEDLINDHIGEHPSYFAQMEILTKKMYQNPKFYSDLYDKPANIERKGAALQAIALMQDRDIYNSLLRSEAVLATLLETLIRKEHDRVAKDLKSLELQDERIPLGR